MTKMTKAQMADFAADAVALSKEHADEAAALRAGLDAVREFSLDMAQISCPRCRADAYPDSLGEALDWALGHQCEEPAP